MVESSQEHPNICQEYTNEIACQAVWLMSYHAKWGVFPGDALNKKMGFVLDKLYNDDEYRAAFFG